METDEVAAALSKQREEQKQSLKEFELLLASGDADLEVAQVSKQHMAESKP